MDAMFVYSVKIGKLMMGQEEHLTGTDQPKFVTRSTARHLRRKRLNEARKAELWLSNGVNIGANQESIPEKGAEETEVITKSKARRLRKKNKAKELLQNYCSFCYPCVYAPVSNTAANEEAVVEKDNENPETITKSKARRLRKKNKAKLLQSGCSFCCTAYPRDVDPALFKYAKTTEYDTNCCNKPEAELVNNHIESYKPEGVAESQHEQAKHDKKAEQLVSKSQNIESEEDLSELSYSSGSSGLLRLGNEVLATRLKTKIDKNLDTKVNSTKEDTQSERLERKSVTAEGVRDSTDLQELDKLTDSAKYDRKDQICDKGFNEEEKNLEFCSNNLVQDVTRDLDEVDFSKDEELTISTRTGVQPETRASISLNQESVENAKNVELNDSPETNSNSLTEENVRSSCDLTEVHNNTVNEVVEVENTESTNIIKEQSRIDSHTESISAQNTPPNSNPSERMEDTEVANVQASAGQNCVTESKPDITTREVGAKSVPQPQTGTSSNMIEKKLTIPEKSREEIKAEREAKKAAKAAAKAKAKGSKAQEKTESNKGTSELTKSVKTDETLGTVNDGSGQITNESVVAPKAASVVGKDEVTDVKTEGKSKAEMRAERRAKQEAQRAAKQEAQRAAKQQIVAEEEKVKSKEVNNVPIVTPTNTPRKTTPTKQMTPKLNAHKVDLFKHLYDEREHASVKVSPVNSDIHPAIVRLGVQYANKVIVGSNARCVALLAAVKQFIKDFEQPPGDVFIRELEKSLQHSVTYLHHCRPLAVSMQNALKHLKWLMTQMSSTLSDIDAKRELGSAIDTYISEQIQLAGKAISITIQTKISNGNVILTYGYSSLIHKILLDAHTAGKKFRVIVVDGRPWLEGKEQLRRLVKHGIECSYILINALSYVMPEVSKVFLGAHAILANGAVMSRVGTAQVALMARAFNVPVLVACETHKSCERVQTDSIVYNELGDADELAQSHRPGMKKPLLAKWKSKRTLNLLNITYDVTPADLVTAVVTELAILPCTSVPVILRIKPSEIPI